MDLLPHCRKLEEAVKAMITSLPLVSELRHPAMRLCHWRQLMKACLYCLDYKLVHTPRQHSQRLEHWFLFLVSHNC